MERLRAEIKAKAAAAKDTLVPAAFVTFNDRYTQTLASAAMHSHDETAWRVQPAPGPDEIVWANLGMRHVSLV